jgi:hypothetical protein
MKVGELIETLKTVSGAIPETDLIPILANFWFERDTVLAYNDLIAIQAPCATGFVGMVPNTVRSFLRSVGNDETVSFTSNDKEVVVEIGDAKFYLLIFPGRFPFVMPKPGESVPSMGMSRRFIHALKTCLLSMSKDTSRPEHLGITIIPGGDKAQLFATDSKTLTWVRNVPATMTGKPERVILPTPFCEQLIAFATTKTFEKIALGTSHAMARAEDGTTLFGRSIESTKPLNFTEIVKHNLPRDYRSKTIPVPVNLKRVMERANIVASLNLDRERTCITVRNGIAEFYTKEEGMAITDKLDLKGQSDTKLSVEAWRVLDVCDHYTRMLLKDDVVIFTSEKGGSIHLISA